MLDAFSNQLNELLVDTYHLILKVEEQELKNTGKIDLSLNEMHVIEAVGPDLEGKTISDIAAKLSITLPSVTVAINKLVKKGYVEKVRGEQDGRTVLVTLTKRGKKMYSVHRYFHEQMIRNISADFTNDEKETLLNGFLKLNEFFKQRVSKNGGANEL